MDPLTNTPYNWNKIGNIQGGVKIAQKCPNLNYFAIILQLSKPKRSINLKVALTKPSYKALARPVLSYKNVI